MDVSNSVTEALNRYHFWREEFHTLIAAAAAGQTLLGSVVSVPNGAEVLGALVDSVGEPWPKGKRFPEPKTTVDTASSVLWGLLIVQALSAFDEYTVSALEDLLEFDAASRGQTPFEHDHKDMFAVAPPRRSGCCPAVAGTYCFRDGLGSRIEDFDKDLDLRLASSLIEVLPLFHYFRRVRNRIVHSNSWAGEGLEDYSKSDELRKAVATWDNTYCQRPSPRLPAIHSDQRLSFLPRHVIMVSTICYEFAKAIDRAFVQRLGEDGIVRMALYYSLVAPEHPTRSATHKRPEAPLGNFLYARFGAVDFSRDSLLARLRELGLWEATVSLHRMRYPEVP